MSGYIINFTVYTLAMVGLIFFALFLFRRIVNGEGYSKKSSFLKVEETMNISPRKTIYVIKAGREKFLIASDADKTALISKLEDPSLQRLASSSEVQGLRQDKCDDLENLIDFESPLKKQTNSEPSSKRPVMRELVRKLQQG